MISATKAWAMELAPDIRVNSVAPGWVDTEMSADALGSDLEEARVTCNAGLLAREPVSLEQYRREAERVLVDAIEPMEELAQGGGD